MALLVSTAIAQATNRRVERSGGVPIRSQHSVSKGTSTHYRAAIAHHLSLVNKASGKTETRTVAESSHRRITSLIGQVGSTHCISVSEENQDLRAELSQLPYETRLMMETVVEARGTPVFPVKPHNLWTLDDSTAYVFAGLSNLKEEVKLTLASSARARGTDSLWVLDHNNSMKGIRVALTCGFSGVGTSMPIVACVSGLSEYEFPGTEFLVLEMPSFCFDDGANITINGLGYVLFMRDTMGAKQEKFRWYQKNVFIPGVNSK